MKLLTGVILFLASGILYGQNPPAEPIQKGFTIDTNTLLIIFAVFLLLPMWVLSNTFITAARRYYAEKLKSGTMKVLLPATFVLMCSSLFAQANPSSNTAWLSNNGMTFFLLFVIAAELLLILFFARRTNEFIQKFESKEVVHVREPGLLPWLRGKWNSMNFKPVEQEHQLDTGHDYDGIRELDNVIPPWFTTAFIITILFGVGYVYRYHIAKSAPMQIEEYQNDLALAELEHDEYLKTQASSIDESNVAVLTGADLDEGKKTFVTLCAACHKTDGGGLVGPCLTDDYWLHGGSLQDIFKTVKYGYPDKGMISWKEQLSPIQMARVANYILTLHGTNPPDAKAKQGDLYVPKETANDSPSVKTIKKDSIPSK